MHNSWFDIFTAKYTYFYYALTCKNSIMLKIIVVEERHKCMWNKDVKFTELERIHYLQKIKNKKTKNKNKFIVKLKMKKIKKEKKVCFVGGSKRKGRASKRDAAFFSNKTTIWSSSFDIYRFFSYFEFLCSLTLIYIYFFFLQSIYPPFFLTNLIFSECACVSL